MSSSAIGHGKEAFQSAKTYRVSCDLCCRSEEANPCPIWKRTARLAEMGQSTIVEHFNHQIINWMTAVEDWGW